jgi:hypothetical protein
LIEDLLARKDVLGTAGDVEEVEEEVAEYAEEVVEEDFPSREP